MNGKVILSASLILASTTANAVTLPGGTSTQPSAIEKRYERRDAPRIQKDIVIKDEREQNDVEGAEEIKFNLEGIEIEGNTVFEGSELQELYAPKVGTEVSLAEIYQLRDEITKKYREEGYVLSRAILPPQRVKSGKVKFDIVEGRVNNVIVQGEFGGDRSIVDDYIAKIDTDGPMNSANLERYLLLINDLYGAEASGTLRPSAGSTGAADLIITLGHDDYSGVVVVDNSGTRFVGETIASGQVAFNSALGQYEEISLRTIIDEEIEELKFFDLTYRQAISDEGTEIRLNAGQSQTKPGSTLAPLDITGDTDVFQVEVVHPYLRSRRENLTLHSGFTFRNVDSDAAGAAIYKDKTRVIDAGVTYDVADSAGGVNVMDITIHQGIGALGASNDGDLNSRDSGSATFTKITADISREQVLDEDFTLLLAAEGQVASSSLLVGEEFAIGGEFGRGYDSSEFTGDHGFAAKAELQYSLDGGYEYLQDYQIYTYYDFGTVWQRNEDVGEDNRDSLASIGIGTRASIVDNVSGFVQISQPLINDVQSEGDDDPRVHFGLNYVF